MKGFTLIELLAVLIILGIVTMITVPMISNQINSAKDKAYDEQINRIEEISRNWGVTYRIKSEVQIYDHHPLHSRHHSAHTLHNHPLRPQDTGA